MKNLTWKVSIERSTGNKLSATFKIKYKRKKCKIFMQDVEADEDFDVLFGKSLADAFGKKKGKKIGDQIIERLSDLN